MLVPKADDVESIDIGTAQWVLVIEKEASIMLSPDRLS